MFTDQGITRLLYTPADMGLILFAPGISIGLSFYFLLKQKVKPFHVDVKPLEMKVMGVNIFPFFIFLMSLIPDSMRRKMMTKQVRYS